MVSKGGKEHAINTGRTSGARPRWAPSTTNLTRYHPIPCTHPTYSYLWLSPRLFLIHTHILTYCESLSANRIPPSLHPSPPPSLSMPDFRSYCYRRPWLSIRLPVPKASQGWHRKVHGIVSNRFIQTRTTSSDAFMHLANISQSWDTNFLAVMPDITRFYMITLY